MKKILLSIIAIWIGASCFAAYQYNQSGDEGFFTFNSDTSLDMRSSVYRNDPQESSTTPILGIKDFGYYNLADQMLVSNSGGFLGTFGVNDVIGIWIQDMAGRVYTTTAGIPDTIFGAAGYTEEDYCIYKSVSWSDIGTPSHYEYRFIDATVPAGQPLPGILATLLAGGGVFLIRRRRNNR